MHFGDQAVFDYWILFLNGGQGRKAEMAGEPVLRFGSLRQQARKRSLPLSVLTWNCRA